MRVLLLNGSPHQRGCTHTALNAVQETLEKHGIETETFWIGTGPTHGCTGCGACRRNGICAFNDAVNEVAVCLENCKGIVVGSPVHYAGISGQLKSFLDRLFFVCGGRLSGYVGAGVVSCRRGGASAAFDIINKYFLMSNMYVAPSQYWNQVHGTSPEEVRRDFEGIQTMRTLGENIAYALRAFHIADMEGVPKPMYEEKVRTNFIAD